VTLSATVAEPDVLKDKIKKDPASAGKLKEILMVAEGSARLRERISTDPRAKEVLDVGCSLEGLNRHAGMHAAGVVIGNRPLWEHVPCFQADGKLVTQYTMVDVEKAGLVKFDFLGLKTLTVIAIASNLVSKSCEPVRDPDPAWASGRFEIESIPLDDPGVYELIARGDTTGVFQLESSGFRELLVRLKPDCIEDIIAAVALYRPGPLEGGMVDQFIDCKHGKKQIEYPHELLETVLKETYGVFVYQEQVMQAAQILAGFSLGGADLMRRAMGKKKKSEMDKQRELFVSGCKEKSDISAKKAGEIFDLIDKFAGYGFNKSHSAAYGLITYQTAYLKHHYRVAFMAALMTCDKDKNENVVKFIAEARGSGIKVLPPCVNGSERDFSIERVDDGPQVIRFGLGAVRNVGENAVDSILAARGSGGPFVSLFEMLRRTDPRKVNKRTLEGLVRAGALDAVAGDKLRAQVFGAIDRALQQGQDAARDRDSGQRGLFDLLTAEAPVHIEEYPDVPEWSAKERLLGEREALGFYLTGHPLDRFSQDVEKFATTHIGNLRRDQHGAEVIVGGVICEFREVQTKSGRGPMGFFQLEDQYGRIEVVAFPKTYARVDEESGLTLAAILDRCGDEPVLCTGKIEVETVDTEETTSTKFKMLLETIKPIAEVRAARTRGVLLRITAEALDDRRLLLLKQVVSDHSGPCKMELQVTADERWQSSIVFGDRFGVTADESLLTALERLFQPGCARLV
ncbi:MAG: DNA polymerase III subunit alpha, partial [Deltaproteobacteria bacterium]|nr:DNA polymerase III subunit alpha [Nannocystaceae bacterium]